MVQACFKKTVRWVNYIGEVREDDQKQVMKLAGISKEYKGDQAD